MGGTLAGGTPLSRWSPPQQFSTTGHDGSRAEAALRKVRVGEVSRARQCLTGAMLAPGTEQTFFQMQSRRPQVEARALSQEVQDFQPDVPVTIDRKVFLQGHVAVRAIVSRHSLQIFLEPRHRSRQRFVTQVEGGEQGDPFDVSAA